MGVDIPDPISLDITDLRFSLPYISGRTSLSGMSRLSALTSTMLQRKLYSTSIIKGINLSLKTGDRVGLIGRNGAGKSTLLRLMAGAYAPTSGSIRRQGKVTSLISVGAGFNRMATGLENITLRGLNLDMTMDEIHASIESIIEFSELQEAIDKPLYTYSDGMRARLAFAIAVETQPDILLLDEWLGAGDQEFQDKAADRMVQFVEESGITVLATHNKRIIKHVCNRVIELEDGRVIRDQALTNATELPINLKEQIRIYEKSVESLESEKKILQEKLKAKKYIIKDMRKSLADIRKHKKRLKDELKEKSNLQDTLEQVRKRKEELRLETRILQKELKSLETHKDELKLKVRESNSQLRPDKA